MSYTPVLKSALATRAVVLLLVLFLCTRGSNKARRGRARSETVDRRPSAPLPPSGMPPRLLGDPDALTLILQQLRVANHPTESLLRLQNFRAVNKDARAHIVVHNAVLVHALLGVDMGMSPLALATMIRQMSPTHRDHLVHLAEQWNTPHAIEDYYFFQCNALAIKTLSPSLTAIGEYAFFRCPSLRVAMWDAPLLTTVWQYAFAFCTNLTLDTWNAPQLRSMHKAVFMDCKRLVLSNWHSPELIAIHRNHFDGCTNLTLANWHAPKLKSIGFFAFKDCSALVWPNGCHFPAGIVIEDSAFHGCTSLSPLARSHIQEINPHAMDPA